MNGHWMSNTGWAVSPAGTRGGRLRFVMRAPNGRRWEACGIPRRELVHLANRLCVLGVGAHGQPTTTKVPRGALPRGVTEILQRKCRDCTSSLPLRAFTGDNRSCDRCIRRRCYGDRCDVGPCPHCGEPCQTPQLTAFSADIGLACPSCIKESEANKPVVVDDRVADRVVARVREQLERPVSAPRINVVDFQDFDQARERLAQAFG